MAGVQQGASVTGRVGDYEVDVTDYGDKWQVSIDPGIGQSVVFTCRADVLALLVATGATALRIDSLRGGASHE